MDKDLLSHYPTIDQLRRFLLLQYFDANKEEAAKYEEELMYLRKAKKLEMIPYEQKERISGHINVKFDFKNRLPYVIHNNKRLYFPGHLPLKEVESQYRILVERECLTGGGFTSKAPHQYQTNSFKVEKGDILLDIGCAEGLVALDTIDLTKKVILFEADPIWDKPLRATFKPYKNKVTIVNKFVSDKTSTTSVTLASSVERQSEETFFVKMDIEGAEEMVVKGNEDFFKSHKIKLACCTYHNAEHFKSISHLLQEWSYTTSASDGYMLCFVDNVFEPPFFRKGLVRATNIK